MTSVLLERFARTQRSRNRVCATRCKPPETAQPTVYSSSTFFDDLSLMSLAVVRGGELGQRQASVTRSGQEFSRVK